MIASMEISQKPLEQIAVETRVHTVAAGAYRAALQISTVDGRRYVDKSWRVS